LRLTGTEPGDSVAWHYDVRLLAEQAHILLEISAHPHSIEHDLATLSAWVRRHTRIAINDEDGATSNGWGR